MLIGTLIATGFGTPAKAGNATLDNTAKVVISHNGAGWHKVDKPVKGGTSLNVTTGWRPISGWEGSIIDRDPNLAHWSWIPMQEMGKSYIHLAPGQVLERYNYGGHPHYLKPNHIPTVVAPKRTPPIVQNTPSEPKYIKPEHVPTGHGGGGNYIKPAHIPTVIPPETRQDTYIKLAAPKTHAVLASKQTSAQLASTATSVKLAAPKVSGQLAAKQTTARLKEPVKSDKVTRPHPEEEFPPVAAEPTEGDTFSNPDPYAHNVYGLARHVNGPVSSAAAHVDGRLLVARKKHH